MISVYNLSYVYPFPQQNERNGSLIDGSGLAPNSLLKKVFEELTACYATTFSRKAIMNKVEQTDAEYRTLLGDQPLFWYLLATGDALSDPHSYGRVAKDYFTNATRLGPQYYHAYCTYLHAELTRRHEADTTQMASEICGQYWIPLLRVERELSRLELQAALAH